jgi:hypothetical protein
MPADDVPVPVTTVVHHVDVFRRSFGYPSGAHNPRSP